MSGDQSRLTAAVHGHVQGVGFRYWVRSRARELGLAGSVANLPDGRVEVVAEGSEESCRALLDNLRGPSTPGHVTEVDEGWSTAYGDLAGFTAR